MLFSIILSFPELASLKIPNYRSMNTTIQQLIDKLSVLAATDDTGSIHIEVMIDTTKQIYEQLYLLKSQHPVAEAPAAAAAVSSHPGTFDHFIQTTDKASGSDTDMNDEITALFNSEYDKTVLDDAADTAAHPGNDTDTATAEQEQPVPPKPAGTAVPTPPSPTIESGISFEFPSTRNVTHSPAPPARDQEPATLFPETKEDLTSEAAIEKISRTEENMPISGQGFKAPVTPNQKDFRSQIGFNDRYLFMNELFHNNKELFDTSISRINNAGTLQDARQWIDEELATHMKWDTNDTTVQSFYALVDKYFNTI